MTNLNISKTLYIAFIVKNEERHYLTGSYWGSGYNFEKFSFLKPLSDIAEQGNKSIREENYIVKATSIADMNEKLKECRSVPKEKIIISCVKVNMEESVVSEIMPSFLKESKSMEDFEKYFVGTEYAKTNRFDYNDLKNLRRLDSDNYIDEKVNKPYQAWKELQKLG